MFEMKKVVVFTGAGVSAESGIKTFRASDGLWEEYNIAEVATPEGWRANPKLVLDFYNKRRKQVLEALPNMAHIALAELQNHFDVQIITQNIDDLHERAGSKKVLHLHGLITEARSTIGDKKVSKIDGWKLSIGDTCERGGQLRPNIVWFGEAVPNMELANIVAEKAEIFIVIGTSLNVYPAAGITEFVSAKADKYLIDPNADKLNVPLGFKAIVANACEGVPKLVNKLISDFS
jgi:NAD-dependent deacetylase